MGKLRNAVVRTPIPSQRSLANQPTQRFAILAAIAPWAYDRYIAASSLLVSRPGKLQNVNSFKSYETLFSDQIRNCEDVILEEKLGVAFLSCDPGRDRWNTVMVSEHI